MDKETEADLSYLRDYAQWLLDQGFVHTPSASKGMLIRMKDLMDGLVRRHIPWDEMPHYWNAK